MIKNLSQLKRAIQVGTVFEIVEHYVRPEYAGQKRVIQVVQTNGFYSGIYGDPNDKISKANYGKGVRMEFGKASNWEFRNDICICKDCFAIKILEVKK